MMCTPIIHLPQSAISGMQATKCHPVVVGSYILARPGMYVALTYEWLGTIKKMALWIIKPLL